jgi:hypothetical protein
MSSSTDTKPNNPFASIKSSTAPAQPLFPPNSPFAKFPPAPTPSGFTPEMASHKPPVQSMPTRNTGPMRTPRHSIRESPQPRTQLLQTPQPQLPTKPMETPQQFGGALVRSNGDNVPIVTPDRNPSDPPEKHYWQRIKAMNEAFSEAVGRSIEGDEYCNLEWLFGQYKYWREEIEKGYPYNPSIDSPAPASAITASKSSTRVEDLKSGIAMKPPTPSRRPQEESTVSFTRSQAPPPETQQLPWDGGSTQSTERTKSFGQSENIPRGSGGSKTAETILGVLDSPDNDSGNMRDVYMSSMDAVKERDTKSPSMFSFGTGTSAGKSSAMDFSGKLDPTAVKAQPNPAPSSSDASFAKFGATATLVPSTSKPESSATTAKPVFGSTTSQPFAFGSSGFAASKPSAIGSFPAPSTSKPFGQTSSTSTSTSFSLSTTKPEYKPSPPKPSQPQPPSNRFAAFAALSPEKEVITIDSDDDEMVDEQDDQEIVEEEEMIDEEEEEEEDEVMDEEVDDVKDEDYITIDDEDEEEEEPVEEEVAKEVEELVKSSPERTEPKASPFSFGTSNQTPAFSTFKPDIPSSSRSFGFGASIIKSTSLTMDDEVPKIQSSNLPPEAQPKEPETSEENSSSSSNAPKPTPPESAAESKPVFRFGLPTTPSTFRPPSTSVLSSSALKKEFKFGLPPVERKTPKESEPTTAPPKSPRQLRSASPAKQTTEEGEVKPTSPKKRQRSASPKKQPSPDKALQSAESAPLEDTIEVQNPAPPSSTEQTKTFSFGGTTLESTKDSTISEAPKSFSFAWTPDKPIKFDTPPPTKPSSTFSFGQSPTAPLPPFSFGGLSTPVPATPPKFGSFGSTSGFNAFGGSTVSFTSPNLGFSFGQAVTKPNEEKTEPESQDTAADEDEPPMNPPVEEIGTAGEEDEETIFSERAKLIQRLSAAERAKEIEKNGGNADEVKVDRDYGIGVVRVNIHKETSKGRILFRLEGSGRVILVSLPNPNKADVFRIRIWFLGWSILSKGRVWFWYTLQEVMERDLIRIL